VKANHDWPSALAVRGPPAYSRASPPFPGPPTRVDVVTYCHPLCNYVVHLMKRVVSRVVRLRINGVSLLQLLNAYRTIHTISTGFWALQSSLRLFHAGKA